MQKKCVGYILFYYLMLWTVTSLLLRLLTSTIFKWAKKSLDFCRKTLAFELPDLIHIYNHSVGNPFHFVVSRDSPLLILVFKVHFLYHFKTSVSPFTLLNMNSLTKFLAKVEKRKLRDKSLGHRYTFLTNKVCVSSESCTIMYNTGRFGLKYIFI